MRAPSLLVAGMAMLLAATTIAQTEYIDGRAAAMQRLGRQLQQGQVDQARHDLADYLAERPGDALMQYNLACLDAVTGDYDAALGRLDRALFAGYRDLERPLHDPDLFQLANDPRLIAKLDSARAVLVDAMQQAAFFLEEGIWSEPLPLAPDPFGPGSETEGGSTRVRFDAAALVVEITPPPAGADELIIDVTLPTNLEIHETRRWFEFRALLATPGPVDLTAHHGRLDPIPRAADLARDGDTWTLTIPWSSLHPFRPPVELMLGLNVVLRHVTGAIPADRWALVRDPHAGSTIQTWRRFAPVSLDPGIEPTPLIAGRLDTYLVIGDSLSVELGIQGLPGGPATIEQFTGADAPDTIFSAMIEPELAYLTLDFVLPSDPANGWFDLAVHLTAPDGIAYNWRDRGFRLQPDWFIEQNARIDDLREAERPIVQYQLFRALRGQQRFQPHDDPTDLADATLAAESWLDRAAATGSVIPGEACHHEVGYPVGDDAMQAAQLVLPEREVRSGAPLVVVITADRTAAELIARDLAANPVADQPRQYLVTAIALPPGQPEVGAAVIAEAATWARELLEPMAVRLVGTGTAAAAALAAAASGEFETVVLLANVVQPAAGVLPEGVTVVPETSGDPRVWATRIREW